MKNVYLYPYKMGSRSCSALSEALESPQIRHNRSKFKGASYKTVINWGAGSIDNKETSRGRVLNKPSVVTVVANKLRFFEHQSRSSTPARLVPWTTDIKVAEGWLREKATVVVRKSLQGHSGHGIIIVEPGDTHPSGREVKLPSAPLYTQYVPKDSEFRIHIMGGKVIFRQKKIKNPEISEPKTWKVRSHDNGFVFQHNDLEVPKDVEVQALLAFNNSGLDFCGVDVVYNNKRRKAYVLEINSAIGMEGETIQVYKDAFVRYIGNKS